MVLPIHANNRTLPHAKSTSRQSGPSNMNTILSCDKRLSGSHHPIELAWICTDMHITFQFRMVGSTPIHLKFEIYQQKVGNDIHLEPSWRINTNTRMRCRVSTSKYHVLPKILPWWGWGVHFSALKILPWRGVDVEILFCHRVPGCSVATMTRLPCITVRSWKLHRLAHIII